MTLRAARSGRTSMGINASGEVRREIHKHGNVHVVSRRHRSHVQFHTSYTTRLHVMEIVRRQELVRNRCRVVRVDHRRTPDRLPTRRCLGVCVADVVVPVVRQRGHSDHRVAVLLERLEVAPVVVGVLHLVDHTAGADESAEDLHRRVTLLGRGRFSIELSGSASYAKRIGNVFLT